MASKVIAVIEDDADVRELLRHHLEREGFATIGASDGASGLELVERQQPALVLLDWMMPGMLGVEVCRRLRSNPDTAQIPLIMVSGKASEVDRVVGLEIGADDYVVKPFSMRELVARIRAVLRRLDPPAPAVSSQAYQRGRLRMNFDTYECFLDDRPLALSLREFQLLKFFVTSPNRVYSRPQLLDLVWGQEVEVGSRTVDVHIRRLRRHLEKDDAHPELIQTVRGIGYLLNDGALL
ncbi:MAG TPA: response regulator transcription factor [Terriglobales bacterium]|nr:response regulator transcription factor [Terriglobales bacterium]